MARNCNRTVRRRDNRSVDYYNNRASWTVCAEAGGTQYHRARESHAISMPERIPPRTRRRDRYIRMRMQTEETPCMFGTPGQGHGSNHDIGYGKVMQYGFAVSPGTRLQVPYVAAARGSCPRPCIRSHPPKQHAGDRRSLQRRVFHVAGVLWRRWGLALDIAPSQADDRGWASNIYTALISTVIVVAMTETGLRVVNPWGIEFFSTLPYHMQGMVDHPLLGYAHPKSVTYRLGNNRVSLNSNGHRDDDMPVAKPAGERRILVLGDSVTFGWGVDQGEDFPARLEALLRQQDNRVWRVINSWRKRLQL